MFLKNAFNITDERQALDFIKQQEVFGTNEDAKIAKIIDEENRPFTTAIVTLIRQLLEVNTHKKAKWKKTLKQVINNKEIISVSNSGNYIDTLTKANNNNTQKTNDIHTISGKCDS